MKDKKRGNGSTAVDPRFAAARTDPRFQRFPKSQRKVEIDERFAGKTSTQILPYFTVCLSAVLKLLTPLYSPGEQCDPSIREGYVSKAAL